MAVYATPRVEMFLPISPLSLSPSAWFKQDSLTQVAETAIAQWDDSSGNARHLVQGTSGYRPVVRLRQGNALRAAAFFDGSDDFLASSVNASEMFGDGGVFTVFCVYSAVYDGTQPAPVWGTLAGDAYPFLNHDRDRIIGSAFPLRGPWTDFGAPFRHGAEPERDSSFVQYHVSSLTFDGETTLLNRGDADDTGGHRRFSGPGRTVDSPLSLGWTTGTPFFKGYVAELIVFSEALTEAERQQVTYYLSQKYDAADLTDEQAGVWQTVPVFPELECSYGITGSSPKDRVASTGSMSFQLDNTVLNDGGVVGYYMPGHPNCRAGFGFGTEVRLVLNYSGVDYFKWRGRVDQVTPASNKGKRRINVHAVDWMDEAARTKVRGIPVQFNLRSDQVFSVLLENVTKQPAATEIGFGMETYPYSLDNVRDEGAPLLTELQRLANSELGYIYVKGDTAQGGTLTFEDRRQRGVNTTSAADFAEGVIVSLPTSRGRDEVINRVAVKVHPRTADEESAGFIPTDLGSTLTCWLKGDSFTALVDGDAISTWTDDSGTGNDFTNASGTDRPTYKTGILNGESVARFDGSNDVLTGPVLSALIANNAHTVFLVYKWSTGAGAEFFMDDSAAKLRVFANSSGATLTHRLNDGANRDATKSGLAPGEFHIATFMHSGGSNSIGVDDTQDASLTSVAAGNITVAGTMTLADLAGGDVAEVIICNSALSEADRKDVESYLADKYDLELAYEPTGLGAGATTVIFGLNGAPPVARGTSFEFQAPYKDPDQRKARIGAADVEDPVATSDYLFNTLEDGTGTDITSQLTVEINPGGNTSSVTVTNAGPLDGFLTFFQLRGLAVRDEGEVVLEAEDETSQEIHGEHLLAFDMAYQSKVNVAQDAAFYLLAQSRSDAMTPEALEFNANRSEQTMLDALQLEISDRIDVSEESTGIDSPFFINAVKLRVRDLRLDMGYVLAPADTLAYWILDSATQSQLDVSTRLAYGLWNRFWILGVAALGSDTRVNP